MIIPFGDQNVGKCRGAIGTLENICDGDFGEKS